MILVNILKSTVYALIPLTAFFLTLHVLPDIWNNIQLSQTLGLKGVFSCLLIGAILFMGLLLFIIIERTINVFKGRDLYP